MILAIDIGNTNIVIGGFENDSISFTARVATDVLRTEEQYAVKSTRFCICTDTAPKRWKAQSSHRWCRR